MMSAYDEELVESLRKEIENEDIKVCEETLSHFNEMGKIYPPAHNGIDWDKKGIDYFKDLSSFSGKEQGEMVSKSLEEIVAEYPDLLDEEVVVLGDSLTELGYLMKFKKFIELQDDFFSVPQHCYVFFSKRKKCINLTFEGYLYFG